MVTNSSNTSILIVEDELAIAESLVDLCELNGYQVKHVADGESGLSEALTGQYGLVLLDVMLPGINGFEVCDKIREKDRSLPIIILSAKNTDEDIINGLKFGADDYIPKPFSVPMLLARIEAVLRRSRQTMEKYGVTKMRNPWTPVPSTSTLPSCARKSRTILPIRSSWSPSVVKGTRCVRRLNAQKPSKKTSCCNLFRHLRRHRIAGGWTAL